MIQMYIGNHAMAAECDQPYLEINPQAPVARKIADEVVFLRFQGEGVQFFLIGAH